MAIEIIRADGTRDEDSFVVIKTLDVKGETVEQQALKELQFHLEVQAGLAVVTPHTSTDGI